MALMYCLCLRQVKRMCSPALIVSNHEAQHFPVIHSAAQVSPKSQELAVFDTLNVAEARLLRSKLQPSHNSATLATLWPNMLT